MRYKFLEHTADIKFRAFGKTLEEVFENTALALKESISGDKIKSVIKKEISSEGDNLEELLYEFLEEFLVLFDGEGFILSKMENLNIEEKEGKYELRASVSGDLVSSEEKDYEISNHVKAVTYNDMFVKKPEKGGNKWTTQVVVDV